MQETLNIRQLLRQADGVATGSAIFNFEARDFLGFKVAGPVGFAWQAKPVGGAVRLELTVEATVQGDCVRCLAAFTRPEVIDKTYDICQADLEGEYPEYPAMPDGQLDLEELAYGELVLEVSPIFTCGEDCQGLCAACGQPKAACSCPDTAPRDPRWQALWGLLDEENDAAETSWEDGGEGPKRPKIKA